MNENTWHTSSYSAGGGNCVEVAEGNNTLVRDSQNRDLATLGFDAVEWSAFMNTTAK